MSKLSVKIADKRILTESIAEFRLVTAGQNALPVFSAGSHIDIHLGGQLVRQYSLVNAPDQTHEYQIAVKREARSRGGSAALHDKFKVGDLVEISAPRNCFPLNPRADHHLLLAGGIGITPLYSMAKHLWAENISFELHYCCRSLADAVYREEMKSLPWAEAIYWYPDDDSQDVKLDFARLFAAQPPNTHLYLCGPQPLMTLANNHALARFSADCIHREYFAATPDTHKAARFTLQLARQKISLEVPAEKTIAEVLQENHINLPLGCEQGLCGACLTKVIAGMPDHRDRFLTDQERQSNTLIMPCCSRSYSNLLVLDL